MSEIRDNGDIVDEPRTESLRALLALWVSRRKGDLLPARADFGLEELQPWFGSLILIDVIDEGADFRYRLIGTRITTFLGRDYSGKLVSECEYDNAENVLDTFRRPVLERAPVCRAGSTVWKASLQAVPYASVYMPLAAGGTTIDMLLGALEFEVR